MITKFGSVRASTAAAIRTSELIKRDELALALPHMLGGICLPLTLG